MPYHLWMGNIVNIATDAIVNAANTELKRTPGICEAIFAAGVRFLHFNLLSY